MAALTKDRKITTTGIRRAGAGPVAASTTIYLGAVLAVNASGYIVPASDAANLKVIGVALEAVDNSAGSAGDKTVSYGTGVFECDNASGAIVQASFNKLCYVADDQSVTTAAAATNDIPVGLVVGFTTTKVMVDIDPAYV